MKKTIKSKQPKTKKPSNNKTRVFTKRYTLKELLDGHDPSTNSGDIWDKRDGGSPLFDMDEHGN